MPVQRDLPPHELVLTVRIRGYNNAYPGEIKRLGSPLAEIGKMIAEGSTGGEIDHDLNHVNVGDRNKVRVFFEAHHQRIEEDDLL